MCIRQRSKCEHHDVESRSPEKVVLKTKLIIEFDKANLNIQVHMDISVFQPLKKYRTHANIT